MAIAVGKPIYSIIKARPELVDRFWSKVRRLSASECWPWQAGSCGKGYGRMKLAFYETRQAHRIAWTIANGRDPGEMVVRHTCDRPLCCNPNHLILGTPADNNRDKMERGRWRGGDQRGALNGNARLTMEQVGQIIAAFRRGESNRRIATRFPVGDDLVSRIRTGRSWRREAEAFGWEPKPLIDNKRRAS